MTEIKDELIYFNSRDELLRIKISDVMVFEADGNYTNLYATFNQKFQLSMNLLAVEQMLDGLKKSQNCLFARIGKRHIVNLHYIVQIQTLKQRLQLSDFGTCNYTLQMSKESLKNLKAKMLSIKL